MSHAPGRCLILACGNTLRSDDGVGPWLANWAYERFACEPGVRVLSRQQWTPELAEDTARAQSVLFIDCSVESPAGSLRLVSVEPSTTGQGLSTHHLGAPELLALSVELYNSMPHDALLLIIGAGSMELGEQFSSSMEAVLPEACHLLEETILRLLAGSAG